jgi:hypothetical protein
VRLQVTNNVTRVKTRTTYRPIALINADYWSGVASSVLTEALAQSLVASGELQTSDTGVVRKSSAHSEKY